jgi:hypothetical protein
MTASPGNSRRITLLALLLIAVLFAIYRLRGFTQRPGAIAPVAVPVTPSPIAAPSADDHRATEARASAAVAPWAAPPTLRDRAVRDGIREKIYRGFGRPLPAAATGAKAAPVPFGSDAGTLDRVYIQKRIRQDFVPLAKECYEAALERDSKLHGKLVVSFVIAGDEDVGGIVESAELDPSSTLVEKELVYCLRESLLSLSFEPPKQRGVVTVTYPFVFSPDGPEPDSGRR